MIAVTDYFPFLKPFLPAGLQAPPSRFRTSDGKPVAGLLAQFSTVDAVCDAAEKVRDEGYTVWDLHSPFPIHGVEEVMGFKRTKLPLISGVVGLTGAGLAWLMQWWMSQNYEIIVQGKPPTAWEPFVPIIFELGVLLTAFATLGAMFAMNGLPRPHHPLFAHEPFLAASDDKFFVYVEARDPKFDMERTRALLESTSPDGEVAVIADEEA